MVHGFQGKADQLRDLLGRRRRFLAVQMQQNGRFDQPALFVKRQFVGHGGPPPGFSLPIIYNNQEPRGKCSSEQK
jgi:hypothetical protein